MYKIYLLLLIQVYSVFFENTKNYKYMKFSVDVLCLNETQIIASYTTPFNLF